MAATLNRKNMGKHFTAVDTATRSIIHWHRPGEPLPIVVEAPDGVSYVIDKAKVAEAQKNQRAPLDRADFKTPKEDFEWQVNGKGNRYMEQDKPVNAALWALGGIVGVAALAVAYEVVKVFA